jgi:hypothetical protein
MTRFISRKSNPAEMVLVAARIRYLDYKKLAKFWLYTIANKSA